MTESVMNYEVDDCGSREWEETTALVAPGVLGVAVGLILGEVMHTSARRGVAIGLAGLGLAAVMPWVVAGVVDKVNGPASSRGVRRRLRGIRDAGDGMVQDELDDNGVI